LPEAFSSNARDFSPKSEIHISKWVQVTKRLFGFHYYFLVRTMPDWLELYLRLLCPDYLELQFVNLIESCVIFYFHPQIKRETKRGGQPDPRSGAHRLCSCTWLRGISCGQG